MDDSIVKIWEKALSLIKEEMSELSYNTWFTNTKPLKIIGGTFYLISDNDFERGMLETRYKALITNALSQVMEQECKVQIVLSEKEVPDIAEQSAPMPKNEGNTKTSNNGGSMNPKYTFEKFVIGENNRFAHAACVAVSEAPSERYNPLFIYGGVGLGKTHLMQAIGNYILSYAPTKKVFYVSC